MPLSGDVLGPSIIAAIAGVDDKSDRDAVMKALATAIVAHIQATAIVNVTVTGTSATGGPVVGTGTGTVE